MLESPEVMGGGRVMVHGWEDTAPAPGAESFIS